MKNIVVSQTKIKQKLLLENKNESGLHMYVLRRLRSNTMTQELYCSSPGNITILRPNMKLNRTLQREPQEYGTS